MCVHIITAMSTPNANSLNFFNDSCIMTHANSNELYIHIHIYCSCHPDDDVSVMNAFPANAIQVQLIQIIFIHPPGIISQSRFNSDTLFTAFAWLLWCLMPMPSSHCLCCQCLLLPMPLLPMPSAAIAYTAIAAAAAIASAANAFFC